MTPSLQQTIPRHAGRADARRVATLRELERADVPAIHAWRQERRVTDMLTGPFRHVNMEADEAWFDRYQASRDTQVRLGIVDPDGALIGVVYLLAIDWISRSAQYGLMIGDCDQWGRGYGSQATALMVEHAFADLNLHRLHLDVLEDNRAAQRVYEKCGFVREGVVREAVYKGGSYRSLVIMGLLKREWEDRRVR